MTQLSSYGFERRDLLKFGGTGLLYAGLSPVAARTRDGVDLTSTPGPAEYAVLTDDGRAVLVGSRERLHEVRGAAGIGSGVAASSMTDEVGTDNNHTDVSVLVDADEQTEEGDVPSGATLSIRASVTDASGLGLTGVPDETLQVAVQNTVEQTEDTFEVTTGQDGTAVDEYDLAAEGRAEGPYNVEVTKSDGPSATAQFRVGTSVVSTSDFVDVVQVGRELTFSFLARDGLEPAPNVDLDLSVTRDGSPVAETTATTDGDGFASITFTPNTPGRYALSASRDGRRLANATITAAETVVANPVALNQGVVGETSFFGGYLSSVDGLRSNTDLTVRFVDESQTFVEQSLTTDESGFFGFEYSIPEGIEPTSLDIVAELADGTEIPAAFRFLFVDRFGADEIETIDAETDDFEYSPGETAQITVDLTADDGGPITGQDVAVFLRYGRTGSLAFTDTVTTDETGQATTSFDIPADAPDGVDLSGDALVELDGETFETGVFARLRAEDILFDNDPISPGGTATLTVDATESDTDNPLEGVPQQVDLLYGADRTGSVGTTAMVSGSDGIGEETVSVPSPLPPTLWGNYVHRYTPADIARPIRTDLPGSLSASVQGREVTLSFDTPDGTTARGIVFDSIFGEVSQSIGTTITTEGSATVRIPEYVSEEFLSFRLWAADDTGQFYGGTANVDFESSGTSVTAALSPDRVELEPTTTTTLDLQMVGASEGIGSYEATVTTNDTSVVTITDVSLNGDPPESTVDIADDGSQAVLDVGGANLFEAGDPVVAELTVESGDGGQTTLSLSDVTVTNANLTPYDTTNVAGTTVTVAEPGPPAIGGGEPATDPDGDDLFEDVDGDGELTLQDVRVLFRNLRTDTVQDNAALFNFGGGDPDEVTVGDLQSLFEEIQSGE